MLTFLTLENSTKNVGENIHHKQKVVMYLVGNHIVFRGVGGSVLIITQKITTCNLFSEKNMLTLSDFGVSAYSTFTIIKLPVPVSAYPEWDEISLTALQAPSWLSPCGDTEHTARQTYLM